jgi:integrase
MEVNHMSDIKKVVLPSGKTRYEFTLEVGNAMKRKTIRKRAKTLKEAKELQARLIGEKNDGVSFGIKFKDLTAQWLKYTKDFLDESTYLTRRDEVKNHLNPSLGEYDIAKMDRALLEDYIAFVSSPNSKKTPARGTIEGRISSLEKLFNLAIKSGYLTHNPAKKIRAPKHLKKNEPIALTDDEAVILLDGLKGTRYYLPAVLGINLGLRVGEIAGLKFEHIDFQNNRIHIVEQYSRRLKKQKMCLKTEQSVDVIDVEPRIIKLIEDRYELKQRDKSRTDIVYVDNDYVCAGKSGKPLNYGWFNVILKKVCLEKGIQEISSHNLRKTLSTRLNEGDLSVNKYEYRKLMRHSIKTAEKHYIQMNKKRRISRETLEKVHRKTLL